MLNVTYLSDTDPDLKCLEKYLGEGQFGKLCDFDVYEAHHDIEMQRKLYELVASRLGVESINFAEAFPTNVTLPTRYESPMQYRLVVGLVEKIRAVAEQYGIDTSDFPHYSSIPTQMVNAQAVKLPCSKRNFLLFDSQLFLYCHLFAKAFALCIPIVGKDEGFQFSVDLAEVKARLSSTPECVERLCDLLGALDETDVPGHAEPYIPEQAYSRLSALFRDGMELFVVAHEFGHVYANHLNSLLPRVSFAAQSQGTSNSSHLQEFEADAIGLLLTLTAQAKRGFDAGLSYIGIELFFHALEMQDKFSHLMKHGSDENYTQQSSATHPSHYLRRMALREGLSKILNEKGDVDAALGLANQYDGVVDILWSEIRKQYG